MGGERPIAIVTASDDELEALAPGLEWLARMECPTEEWRADPWGDPRALLDWAEGAEARGVRVMLVAAGLVPHLPGMVAAACRVPVVAVPLALGPFDEHAVAQLALATSPAAPVAAVEPGAAEAAAVLALRIAAADPRWRPLLDRRPDGESEPAAKIAPRPPRELHHAEAPQTPPVREYAPAPADEEEDPFAFAGLEGEEEPAKEDLQVRPARLDQPLSGPVVGAAARGAEGEEAPEPPPARKLGRRRIDPEMPDVDLIEEAVDCLLEGGIVAFPTETVYGIAADATNPRAVERLFALKGRAPGKAITLLVDNPRLLAGIARNLTVDVRRLMEAFWPGPLTIVFEKRAGNFGHVSPGETIGVRLPDHSVPLALMQALARPLACTSANLADQPEALDAGQIEDYFGDRLNLVLDAGRLEPAPPSTVIDITVDPYRILRQGPVSVSQIAAIVGDKVREEN